MSCEMHCQAWLEMRAGRIGGHTVKGGDQNTSLRFNGTPSPLNIAMPTQAAELEVGLVKDGAVEAAGTMCLCRLLAAFDCFALASKLRSSHLYLTTWTIIFIAETNQQILPGPDHFISIPSHLLLDVGDTFCPNTLASPLRHLPSRLLLLHQSSPFTDTNLESLHLTDCQPKPQIYFALSPLIHSPVGAHSNRSWGRIKGRLMRRLTLLRLNLLRETP